GALLGRSHCSVAPSTVSPRGAGHQGGGWTAATRRLSKAFRHGPQRPDARPPARGRQVPAPAGRPLPSRADPRRGLRGSRRQRRRPVARRQPEDRRLGWRVPPRGLGGARLGKAEPDRQLSTVMFTDIVDSTERVARLGDARWRELVRFRGREIDTAGDGFFATSAGPPARSPARARSPGRGPTSGWAAPPARPPPAARLAR